MEVNPETSLQAEIAQWAKLAADSGFDEMLSNVREFQEWLSGVPGIDEATALSNVIGYVESGEYDTIVFDTAPTGHTLKLLQLPQILQLGLDKLNSWQSKLWGYWTAMKGAFSSGAQMQTLQQQVAARLTNYKTGIEKIGVMLKDRQHTNFVVVCIAEHLSINETRRLLRELVRHQVEVSHVIVNQLVVNNLEPQENAELEALLARAQPTEAEEGSLLRRMRASLQLCNARRNIQQKYLGDLRQCAEVTESKIGIVEMPLLSTEVTGVDALLAFSLMLVPPTYRSAFLDGPAQLEGWVPHPLQMIMPTPEAADDAAETAPQADANKSPDVKRQKVEEERGVFAVGDKVILSGLVGGARFNGSRGTVHAPEKDGRVAVRVIDGKQRKVLALKPTNLSLVAPRTATPPPATEAKAASSSSAASTGGGLFDSVLADPEVQEKLKIPKFAQALEAVKANPASFFQYMGDPEIGPFITKMMGRMGF